MNLYYAALGHFIERRRSPLAPLITGFALAVVVLAGQTRLGAWLRGFLSSSRRVRLGERLIPFDACSVCLDDLREWILGRNMAMVVSEFGPARGASGDPISGITPWMCKRGRRWLSALSPASRSRSISSSLPRRSRVDAHCPLPMAD
jgi:hypothetical protein